MPLDEEYDKQIRSEIADMKNIGGRPGRLHHRCPIHPAFCEQETLGASGHRRHGLEQQGRAMYLKGATAFGVRLLDRLVADHYEG